MSRETPTEKQFSTKAFQGVYLFAIGVATVGWAYFLIQCGLALLGY
jgi:hypothetical protein